MATYNAYVHRTISGRLRQIHLGSVEENNERAARCAALSKFGASDEEYYAAVEAGDAVPKCITLADDFSVSPV